MADSYAVNLPFDILPMIFKRLPTPDIYSCALANKACYAAAKPLIWSHIDHKNYTYLIRRPELAGYVYYATEDYSLWFNADTNHFDWHN
ncbi:hypothetical protein BOTBODRAFT_67816, partial [Botryobasidium botryosum FD-172 SS1]